MCLIEDNMLEGDPLEDFEILHEELVVGEKYLELRNSRRNDVSSFGCMQVIELIILDWLSCLNCSFVIVEKAVETCPFFYLTPPLLQGSQRRKHKKRAQYAFMCMKMEKKGDCLYGFSETHLVS